MKWMRMCSAVVMTLGVAALAEAGIVQVGHCGAEKACGCAPSCQPCVCQPKIYYKPVVCRPTCPSVHGYQRQCLKPASWDACCNNGCGKGGCNNGHGCGPTGPGCAPANCAAPAPASCCAPAPAPATCAAPAPATCCAPAPAPATCAAPAPATCCAPAPAPAPATCCAPAPAPATCCAPAPAPATCCAPAPAPAQACCGPKAAACGHTGCGTGCAKTRCCDADPCEIAHWIYISQTACYAKDRRKAIHKLGDNFDCVCNPEIMGAFVYALNDCDERVRAKAADEIGDQLRKNPCCCSQCVSSALICALGDCDKKVRKQAEEALCLCGYEVADCCNTCSHNGCGTAPAGCCATGGSAAPATVPMEEGEEAAPAPAPPAPPEGDAYFPKRIREQQTHRPAKKGLGNLFGMLN